MHSWPVQDAKARFSELLEACVSEGPQFLTKHGTQTAVLVPVAEWQRLSSIKRTSLKALLMTDVGRVDFELPARRQAKRRAIGALGHTYLSN